MTPRLTPRRRGESADRAPARDGNLPSPHASAPAAGRDNPNDSRISGSFGIAWAAVSKTPFALHRNFFPLSGTTRPGPCALRANQGLPAMLAWPKPAPCFFVPDFGTPCTCRCSTMTDAPWRKRIGDQAKLPGRRWRPPQPYPRRTRAVRSFSCA